MLSKYSMAVILIFGILNGFAHAEGVAPLPADAGVGWSHAPYAMGECDICHVRNSREDPGPIKGAEVNALCYECHGEFEHPTARVIHAAVEDSCTNCHNPHNSAYRKLLINKVPRLCVTCHEDVWDQATKAPVQHEAVTLLDSCLNCHTPHASDAGNLLKGPAYNLCIGCHSVDGLTDGDGEVLTNFSTLLKENPVVHAPIEARDCSACHTAHGGKIFRLLVTEYPAEFYAPYNPENYKLCFTCHNSEIVSAEETTTLTDFRDGNRNLHDVHVHKKERGRTCRACHEVHAAPQPHLIRDGVPYGKSGWILKINYTPTPNGGSCEKTCHGAFSYDRTKSPEKDGAS